jgi:glycosyltransferase involved in cell wall biosynthesis
MESNNPLVSIIIPTYKRSEKLSRAILSVLKQSYSNIEVLVVSDNEPDDEYSKNAQMTVDSFKDNRVKLVLQEHHKNGAAARNCGIKASKGELIAFLDDDDFWDRDKLEKQVRVIADLDDSWGGVSCLNKIYKGGKLIRLQQGYKSGKLYKKLLMRRVEVSTDTILLRRKALFDAGLFDENLLRHQEVQLLTNFTYKYKLFLLNEYLVNVDIDDTNNRPDPEKLRNVKRLYLQSVKDVISSLPVRTQKDIELMNKFEVGGLYIRQGNRKAGIAECACVLRSPTAFFNASAMVLRKIRASRTAKAYPNKDMPIIV